MRFILGEDTWTWVHPVRDKYSCMCSAVRHLKQICKVCFTKWHVFEFQRISVVFYLLDLCTLRPGNSLSGKCARLELTWCMNFLLLRVLWITGLYRDRSKGDTPPHPKNYFQKHHFILSLFWDKRFLCQNMTNSLLRGKNLFIWKDHIRFKQWRILCWLKNVNSPW
jgi:hypothetical protein